MQSLGAGGVAGASVASETMILALILAVAIGLALGLLGGGGSIITVPVLVYAADVPPPTAVAMSLVIVGAASVAGAMMKWREGAIHGRASFLFGASGIGGALVGSQFTAMVPPPVLLLLFAILMVAVALRMLTGRPVDEFPAAAQFRPWRCASAGAGVGMLTGFLGVGGGFLIVPALMHFGRIPLKAAIGTSLVIIAVNSFAGLAGHLRHGALDWTLTGLFVLMAMVGMAGGVRLAARVPRESLGRWFAWFVIAGAVYVVANNWRALDFG